MYFLAWFQIMFYLFFYHSIIDSFKGSDVIPCVSVIEEVFIVDDTIPIEALKKQRFP